MRLLTACSYDKKAYKYKFMESDEEEEVHELDSYIFIERFRIGKRPDKLSLLLSDREAIDRDDNEKTST
jgi:hypothetical protein